MCVRDAQSFDLACMNTWFHNLNKFLIAYESGGVVRQKYNIMDKGEDKSIVTICKVILGEA